MARPRTIRPNTSPRQDELVLVAVMVLAGLAARAVLSWQSPWYDELYTIQHFVIGSWADVFWSGYSPNNHLLYTVAARVLNQLTMSVDKQIMRLPSEAAGLWIPWLLAAGCRRDNRPLALLIVGCAMLNPWLLTFSSEARGYALMLALTLLATNLLGDAQARVSWRYILAMTGAILTVPIAGLALPGHAVASLRCGKPAALRWLLSAAGVLVLCTLIYLPQLGGALGYFGGVHAIAHGLTLIQLLPIVMWHAVAGFCAGPVGWGWVMLPAVVLLAVTAWRLPATRDIVLTCAIAAILTWGILSAVPLFPGDGRILLWLIPLVCLGLASIVSWAMGAGPARLKAGAIAMLVVSGLAAIPVFRTPAQPIEGAISLAWARSQEDHRYPIGAGLASLEAHNQFGTLAGFAYDVPQLQLAEQASENKIRLIVFHPYALAYASPQFWEYIQAHYKLETDLSGRVSDCQIFSR